MDNKPQMPNKSYIWVNIDFDKVKNRINIVTSKIEQVIQKYQFSTKTRDSGKRNN
ncbi:hypothetical protein [Nostoc linckia]|jgi:uncharacterized protein YpuA (DUF1002 family)|uniref:hypothetical protein n=1 Tax=Nostoc linckia TaxID=92942 RepID=UPI0015D48F9B|nr:hypothetical protein [Nostoc linckia]MBC1237152.1 hypothetical protein [Nostoc sp. 2RC]